MGPSRANGFAATRRIAALIPAYQASPSVRDVAHRTFGFIRDVLVIDDGSDDGTASEAARSGAEVVSLPLSAGKGTALHHGFGILLRRGFEAVVTLDADGQHLPEEIPKLVGAWLDGAHLVLGTRDHTFGEMSPLRRAAVRISSRLISLAAGQTLNDVQTGFRVYTRSLIEATGFPESRFDAESAVVVRAARLGFPIATVPVRLGFVDGRPTSHYRPLADSLRIAHAVTRARIGTVTERRARRPGAANAIQSQDDGQLKSTGS